MDDRRACAGQRVPFSSPSLLSLCVYMCVCVSALPMCHAFRQEQQNLWPSGLVGWVVGRSDGRLVYGQRAVWSVCLCISSHHYRSRYDRYRLRRADWIEHGGMD